MYDRSRLVSNALLGVGGIMVVIGLLIMFSGSEQMALVAYQVIILGAMFFGLGVVVISVGVLNNSIKNQTESQTHFTETFAKYLKQKDS